MSREEGKIAILENIEIRNLRGLSLQVPKGKITVLLGPNGSGKTTVVELLIGKLKPHRGKVIVRSADIGFVPDSNPLFYELSVRDNLQLYLALWGREFNSWVREVINAFNLLKYWLALPTSLSYGWRRRLTLATRLAAEHELILLDEPTLGLDEEAQEALIYSISSLVSRGRTFIITTQDIKLVEGLKCSELELIELDRIDTKV